MKKRRRFTPEFKAQVVLDLSRRACPGPDDSPKRGYASKDATWIDASSA